MQKNGNSYFMHSVGWRKGDIVKCTEVGEIVFCKKGDYFRIETDGMRLRCLNRVSTNLITGYHGTFVRVHCKLAKGVGELFRREDGWGFGDRVRCVFKGEESVFQRGSLYDLVGKGGPVFSLLNNSEYRSGVGDVFFMEY